MSPFWQVLGFVSVALSLLAVGQMQRRSFFRPYPFLAAFLAVHLLTGVAQWAQLMVLYSLSNANYARLYWTTEFTLQFLITLVMIAFIYRALSDAGNRWKTMGMVAAVVVVAALVAVLSTMSAPSLRWASLLVRNVSFISALLNLFLWQSLLKNRLWDVQLLMLSLGAGFWTTGRAIGHSLRLMSPMAQTVGDTIIVLTELLSLTVWCIALTRFSLATKPAPVTRQPASPA